MRIALVCELFYPYVKGGVERRYWEIARRLSRKHEVHVFTMRIPGTPAEESLESVSVHRTCDFKTLYNQQGRRRIEPAVMFAGVLFRRLMREKEHFDLVDCSAFPYLSCYPSKAFSRKQRTPMVVTFHEVWAEYWHEYLQGWFTAEIGKFIEYLTARLPNLIISVSKLTADDLTRHLRISPRRVVVIPNGVDLELFETRVTEKNPLKILYVGRLAPHKHVDWLIEAIARVQSVFPDVSLHIVGDGPEGASLRELTMKLDLSNRVFFHGTLPTYEEVAGQMKSSSVFVLPSTREGFSMAVLESMASSTPVVMVRSEHNAALEIVRDNENGMIVEPGDPEAMAEKIIRLLDDPGLRKKLAENARKTSELLSWESVVRRVEETYVSLISRKSL